MQGGGLGIIGDLLFSQVNRFGGGVAETIVGPGGQFLNNTVGAATRNAVAALDGDAETETSAKKDLVKLALSETPGLSLWYARLAIERTFGDMAHEWATGESIGDRYAAIERYAAEKGTQYFAPPGSRFDWRAPDLGNALGAPAEADEEFIVGP